MRRANAATPILAMTAPATAATPPPTKTSVQGTPAARLGHGGNRQRLVRPMVPVLCREPAELFLGQDFAVVLAALKPHDHRIEFPPIEALQQVSGQPDPNLDQ
ncbi:MAG: hypothetical protein VW405_14170 [Rhodospirillaceae bacterium]